GARVIVQIDQHPGVLHPAHQAVAADELRADKPRALFAAEKPEGIVGEAGHRRQNQGGIDRDRPNSERSEWMDHARRTLSSPEITGSRRLVPACPNCTVTS